jgi:hypothetical protein
MRGSETRSPNLLYSYLLYSSSRASYGPPQIHMYPPSALSYGVLFGRVLKVLVKPIDHHPKLLGLPHPPESRAGHSKLRAIF